MGGFLKHLPIPPDFENRVVNIHPALIPAFCGQGFYGHLVHEAVALLDDKAARQAALNAGLRVLGVIGLLRLAKRQGLVKALRADLEALVKSGYFLSPTLIADTLRAEGE